MEECSNAPEMPFKEANKNFKKFDPIYLDEYINSGKYIKFEFPNKFKE